MEKILTSINFPDIELIPFALKLNDEYLKKQYLGWLKDKDVIRLIGSEELAKKNINKSFIEESFKRFTSKNCNGFFIFHKFDNVFIGTAKLDKISKFTNSAEDGILIGEKNYWGKGISKKVYSIILDYAFFILNLNKVSGGCNEKNISMIKTFKSMGYKHEGTIRKSDNIEGELSDHLYFGILKEEFIQKKNAKF